MPRSKMRDRTAEPHVGLGIDPLEAQAVEYLLRAHVEPAHVDIGPAALEGVLQQSQLIAAVGGVENDRGSVVVRAGGKDGKDGKESKTGTQHAPPRGRVNPPALPVFPALPVTAHAGAPADSRTSRNAPGTPAGSCRKKLSPV